MTPLRARLAEVQLALMLLTRLPAGRMDPAPTIAAAAWAFPVAGLVVGGLQALVLTVGLHFGLPIAMAAGVALAAGVLTTGGLHEDGLADCADGFGGGRTAARKLEIMRDSRIGSYGALALLLALGLRWQGLAAAAHPGLALIALGATSRAAMVPVLAWLPAARGEGMGKSASGVAAQAVWVAVPMALALAALGVGMGPALGIGAVQACVVTGFSWLARRQIGGQTGDVLGATQQLAEIAGWLLLAAVAGGGTGG